MGEHTTDFSKHTDEFKPKRLRSEHVLLPSGAVVDLFDFDLSVCRTAEDLHEVMLVCEEKIIEIEYQIDLFKVGYHAPNFPVNKDTHDPTWRARANKALAYAKMQKSEVQLILSRKNTEDRHRRATQQNQTVAELFLKLAKAWMPKNKFDELIGKANDLEAAKRAKATGDTDG